MPSDRVAACFADIAAACDLIERWVDEAGGIDDALERNLLVRSAIERKLLVISEAAVRLHKLDSAAGSALAPEIDWPGIRGIGNFIRHKYDDLDVRIIADALQNRISVLRGAAQTALTKLLKNDSQ